MADKARPKATTRREVLTKAVFVAPAILTLTAAPAFASAGRARKAAIAIGTTTGPATGMRTGTRRSAAGIAGTTTNRRLYPRPSPARMTARMPLTSPVPSRSGTIRNVPRRALPPGIA